MTPGLPPWRRAGRVMAESMDRLALALKLTKSEADRVPGALKAAMDAFNRVWNPTFWDRAAEAVSKFGHAIAGLSRAVSLPGMLGAGVSAAVRAPSQIAAGALAPVTAPISAIGQVGNALGQLTAKANPSTFIRFNLALEDSQAVLGRALTPAMEGVTELMRALGDAIATNEESFKMLGEAMKKVFQALKPVIEAVVTVAAKIAENLAPVLEFLADVIGNVVGTIGKVLKWLDDQATKSTAKRMEYVADIMEKIGDSKFAAELRGKIFDMTNEKDKPQRSSVGAAVRSTSMISGEDIGRRIFQAAFMGGAGKEDKQVVAIDQVKAAIAQVYELLRNTLPQGAASILETSKQSVDLIRQSVVGTLSSFVEPEMP